MPTRITREKLNHLLFEEVQSFLDDSNTESVLKTSEFTNSFLRIKLKVEWNREWNVQSSAIAQLSVYQICAVFEDRVLTHSMGLAGRPLPTALSTARCVMPCLDSMWSIKQRPRSLRLLRSSSLVKRRTLC